MITLEDARKQLLVKIEIELCRNYDAGSKAPEKLKGFYDKISELPLSNIIFAWYRKNAGNVCLKCIDEEIRIYKSDVEDAIPHSYNTRQDLSDTLDELLDEAFENELKS